MPTDIGRWLLRSAGIGSWWELAVEVQQARKRGGEKEKEKARRPILKSNNPHLAGREQRIMFQMRLDKWFKKSLYIITICY